MLLGARATFVATLRARGASSVLPINSAQPSSLITPPFISSFQRCFSSSSSPSSSPSSSSSTTTPSSALATTNASSTPARRVEKIPSAATGEFTVQGPDSKFSDVENKPKVVWRPTWQSLYQTEEGKTVKGYEHSNKRLFEGKTPTVPQKYIPTLLPPAPDIRERDEEKEHFEGDVPDASVSGMTGGLRERPPESRGVWLQARNEMNESVAVGRRKRASANVRIVPNGDGSLWVNDRPFAQYFPEPHLRERALVPFVITETLGKFTTYCSVSGGGTNSQAEALTQGIARALQKWDPTFRSGLKLVGLLKRDPREVERKKPGQPKARKKFQWSKR